MREIAELIASYRLAHDQAQEAQIDLAECQLQAKDAAHDEGNAAAALVDELEERGPIVVVEPDGSHTAYTAGPGEPLRFRPARLVPLEDSDPPDPPDPPPVNPNKRSEAERRAAQVAYDRDAARYRRAMNYFAGPAEPGA